MREQSASYSPFSDVRKSDFRVDFEIIDRNAEESAMFEASGTAVGGVDNLQDRINNAAGQVSLEHNMWMLNGSRTIMKEGENPGWWSSAISNSDAGYNQTYLAVSFGRAVSTMGLTINFDQAADIYPTKIRITTYGADGVSIISSAEYVNNGPVGRFEFRGEEYYSLRIDFLNSKYPGYRVRVSEVIFGIVKRYDSDSIVSLKLSRGANFVAESLPSAQLEVSVDNSDRAYDLLAPQNIFAYLQEGAQPITMKAIINDEAVDMGLLYYTSAKVGNDGMTATITANDKVYVLDNSTYTGSSGAGTLAAVVNEVLQGMDLRAEYEDGLANTVVNRFIPANTKKREAIRLLAQASCCTCWINRDGVLHFGKMDVSSAPVQTITDDELYNFNGVSISPYVGAVQLIVRNEFDNTEEVYTSGLGASVKVVRNPCAYNGQAVANWLYDNYQRRRRYAVNNQGDPALEVGDTVKIYDAYNQNLNAAMTGFELAYDGALSIITSAVGER